MTKELEALKTIKIKCHPNSNPSPLVDNALDIVEKSIKALEIISKKNVDMLLIKKYDNASDYNSAVWLSGREKLTEDEFNLLKECLE